MYISIKYSFIELTTGKTL